MSIFQKSIVKKHISSENPEVLKAKWNLFTSYFHNATIQENIHNSKEEQFQEGFLRELFVKVLGYTLNPEPNFNLTTEYKNIKDSKKADGAIIINNTVTAVIELKGTAITDLGKVESQAFNYKNNQHQCLYVITSNFEKLRFYIDNAIEHIEFNLFKLTEEEFQLLYLCLAFKNIENNVPKNIKDESVSQEDVITKKLYNNYSLFKRELHHNLVALNPGNDPLELFQKSQKLLDRFLFIFFAEDRGLLPTNLIFRINKEWQQLREMRIDVSLYDRYKIYFSDLNVGAKVSLPAFSQTASNKKEEFQIYAYNGGLFKEDDELNTLKIDDELLFKHTEKLSNYDFASEVDVNILGHIFENSLNELDEIKAQIEGQEIDKTKTKRKKDGVFYTPKYITKYIVDNTVGKLCTDKKVEFKISEEEYITDKKRNKTTIQNLAAKLSDYRNWLLQITICDPACGSGAFLNQALDFLINEHKYIDELQAKLFGDAIVMSDVEQSILENNLFGVDINEESVEIAKLSLWLRTAQPNRKLNDLNNNIKCGNSLIDDVAVAGDKAFNWEQQFTTVFENGGFDIIIGNPPYVRVQTIKGNIEKESFEFEKKYNSATRRYDLFVLFIEKSKSLIKENGTVSYILPHKFLVSDFGYGIRKFLKENNFAKEIIHFGHEIVFPGVSAYTCILKLSNNNEKLAFKKIKPSEIFDNVPFQFFNYSYLNDDKWELIDSSNSLILNKISNSKNKLEDVLNGIFQGIKNTSDKIFMMKGYFKDSNFIGFSDELGRNVELESGIMMPVAKGRDIKRNINLNIDYYVTYPHFFDGLKTVPLEEEDFINKYPKAYEYLLNFKESLIEKKIRFKTNPKYWYSLHRSREIEIFRKSKIVVASIQNSPNFTIDKLNALTDAGGYVLSIKDGVNLSQEQLLPILNSKLLWFYIKNTSSVYSGGYYLFNTTFLNPFPLPEIEKISAMNFSDISSNATSLAKALEDIIQKFEKSIKRKFDLNDLPKKLENWYLLSYSDFIKELAKKKIMLSLSDEAEWEEYFNTESKKALELKSQINETDKEIDQLVYKLYDLTEEEIAIVEKV